MFWVVLLLSRRQGRLFKCAQVSSRGFHRSWPKIDSARYAITNGLWVLLNRSMCKWLVLEETAHQQSFQPGCKHPIRDRKLCESLLKLPWVITSVLWWKPTRPNQPEIGRTRKVSPLWRASYPRSSDGCENKPITGQRPVDRASDSLITYGHKSKQHSKSRPVAACELNFCRRIRKKENEETLQGKSELTLAVAGANGNTDSHFWSFVWVCTDAQYS